MNKSKPPEAASATPPPRCPPKAGNQPSTTAWMEPSTHTQRRLRLAHWNENERIKK